VADRRSILLLTRQWAEPEPAERARERIAFLSDVAVFGGLISILASNSHRTTQKIAAAPDQHMAKSDWQTMTMSMTSSSTPYGADSRSDAGTVIGVATVPLNLPVVISAEVEIARPKP
jgi:hypothetical protein